VELPGAGEGERGQAINRWTAILEQFRSAQSVLNDRSPRRVLTAGGDCACDIAIIDYLHRQYPNLTVVWVDAHYDANTPETSPSGNFHGMPVAAIMGSAPQDLRPLLGTPLPPSQFRYVAAHLADDGDRAFQHAAGLSWLEPGEPVSGPVHIHFDLDSLDASEFPHVAYPDGTLSIEAGLDLVRRISASSELVGLTITEFAPADRNAAKGGARVLEELCKAATGS
jgi:arginase